jgi:hypothetical protein
LVVVVLVEQVQVGMVVTQYSLQLPPLLAAVAVVLMELLHMQEITVALAVVQAQEVVVQLVVLALELLVKEPMAVPYLVWVVQEMVVVLDKAELTQQVIVRV